MGADTSATHVIFFIAAVVLAGTVVGTLTNQVGRFQNDLGDRSDLLSDELQTDIRIINDAADMQDGPLVLYVLNTGSRTLDTVDIVVFVDGAPYTELGLDVLDSADDDTWRRGEVLEVTVTGLTAGAGDHRAKVSVAHGVSDTLRFRI